MRSHGDSVSLRLLHLSHLAEPASRHLLSSLRDVVLPVAAESAMKHVTYMLLGLLAIVLIISGEHVPDPLGYVYCVAGSWVVTFLGYRAARDR